MKRKKNPLTDEQFLMAMLELKETNPEGFMDLVYSTMETFPNYALEDGEPLDKKIKAVTTMLKFYEGSEMYERCAFLLDTLNKLKDEKRSVRNNE